MSEQGPEPNWAWLGLLKWSLSHIDGTVPSEESKNFREMSAEDRAFLEEVMTNGIIDEGKRMKTILSNLVDNLESIKDTSESSTNNENSEENLIELLDELQDIVEQIDFAQSFANMGGVQFLIGCASERESVPRLVRSACLGVIATLCQNNPTVQYSMLEQGNIPKLTDMYFAELPPPDEILTEGNDDSNDTFRGKAIQAMSCCVRNHAVAEKIFCMNAEGRCAIESGLGLHRQHPLPTLNLRRRALFFLQALLTSDSADGDRLRLFSRCVNHVASTFCDPDTETSLEMREMTLAMLNGILNQKRSVNAILEVKGFLLELGVRRVTVLRASEGGESEYVEEELEQWQSLIVGLARACSDSITTEEVSEQPLLLEGRPANGSGETLPQ